MLALVTGASGFVGSAVAREILAAGHEVRALVRPTSEPRNLAGLRVETIVGDLASAAALELAVRDCDAVFHVAADYRLWVRDPAALYRANVEGTRLLLGAAAGAGVKKIVFTSSVATIGSRACARPADEDAHATLDDMVGHYKRSKFLAEAEVLRLAREEGLPAVVVNPSTPVGPRDARPTPTGRMVLDTARGRMPAYVDTGLNVVHVDDVARGHLLAWERGAIGERYILGGENLWLRDLFARIARLAGRPAPRIRLPLAPLFPLALACELYARLAGGAEPRLTLEALRMARKPMFFTSGKAQRELGFEARAAERALEDAVAWYRGNGYLD